MVFFTILVYIFNLILFSVEKWNGEPVTANERALGIALLGQFALYYDTVLFIILVWIAYRLGKRSEGRNRHIV